MGSSGSGSRRLAPRLGAEDGDTYLEPYDLVLMITGEAGQSLLPRVIRDGPNGHSLHDEGLFWFEVLEVLVRNPLLELQGQGGRPTRGFLR